MGRLHKILSRVLNYNHKILYIVVPIILIPIPVVLHSKIASGAYIVVLMTIFWVTEVLPLYVTAMLPVVLAPILRVTESKNICSSYMKDMSFVAFGGIIVAIAFERWKAHHRFALLCMKLTGTSPRRLILGIMLPTWLLSMWVSNTATCAMMMPVIDGVLEEIELHTNDSRRARQMTRRRDDDEQRETRSETDQQPTHEMFFNLDKKEIDSLAKCLNLAVAYSASIGGISSLKGTWPNLVLYSQVKTNYGSNTNLNYGTWMAYGLPFSVFGFVFIWFWLQLCLLGPKETFFAKSNPETDAKIKQVIEDSYHELGPVTFAEGSAWALFTFLIFLWISKKPGVDGWIVWFTEDKRVFTTDATPAVLISILLFVWPSHNPFASKPVTDDRSNTTGSAISIRTATDQSRDTTLLSWGDLQHSYPWGILLLMGGGFAMQEVCESSGISMWIGHKLTFLKPVPLGWLILIVVFTTALFTEFASNTATASLFLPILNDLAKCLHVHPLSLMLPATIACSFAFCLPTSTPSNVIIFARGAITVSDMFKVGMGLHIFCSLLIAINTLTIGTSIFGLWDFPSWIGTCSNQSSATMPAKTGILQ